MWIWTSSLTLKHTHIHTRWSIILIYSKHHRHQRARQYTIIVCHGFVPFIFHIAHTNSHTEFGSFGIRCEFTKYHRTAMNCRCRWRCAQLISKCKLKYFSLLINGPSFRWFISVRSVRTIFGRMHWVIQDTHNYIRLHTFPSNDDGHFGTIFWISNRIQSTCRREDEFWIVMFGLRCKMNEFSHCSD